MNPIISANYGQSSFDSACSGVQPPHTVQHDLDLIGAITNLVKPGAKVNLVQVVKTSSEESTKLVSTSELVANMKLAGLAEVSQPEVIQAFFFDTFMVAGVVGHYRFVEF